MCPFRVKWSSRYFPKRDELSLITVRALPKDSIRGLTYVCMGRKAVALHPFLPSVFPPSLLLHSLPLLSVLATFPHFSSLFPFSSPFPPLPPYPFSSHSLLFPLCSPPPSPPFSTHFPPPLPALLYTLSSSTPFSVPPFLLHFLLLTFRSFPPLSLPSSSLPIAPSKSFLPKTWSQPSPTS